MMLSTAPLKASTRRKTASISTSALSRAGSSCASSTVTVAENEREGPQITNVRDREERLAANEYSQNNRHRGNTRPAAKPAGYIRAKPACAGWLGSIIYPYASLRREASYS